MKFNIAQVFLGFAFGVLVSSGAVVGSVYAFTPQPHMQKALSDLEAARHELDVAAQDKNGHRAKAIEVVDSAIFEVKAGIAAGQ
jgi:hypothetical protein